MSCRLRLLHATASVLLRIAAAGSGGVAGARREQRSQGSHGLRAFCVPDQQVLSLSLSLSKEQRISYVFVQILFYLWLTRCFKKILANITIDRKLQPVVVFLVIQRCG
jgi:hypothetical protein